MQTKFKKLISANYVILIPKVEHYILKDASRVI